MRGMAVHGGCPQSPVPEFPVAWDRFPVHLGTKHQRTEFLLEAHGISGCGKNPMLVADALRDMMTSKGIATRDALAKDVGLGPELVGRFLRLHDLDWEIQEQLRGMGAMIGRGRITETDLRAIARMQDAERARAAFRRLVERKGLC